MAKKAASKRSERSKTEQDPTLNNRPATSSGPCTTFTCFPKLPIELRFKIWKEVCFQRRNICVSMKTLGSLSQDDRGGQARSAIHLNIYVSRSSHPAILHTSHESRKEGLKYYKLEFGSSYTGPLFTFSTPAQTYINWQADRLCVNEPAVFTSTFAVMTEFMGLCQERGLRSIAINADRFTCGTFLSALAKGSTPVQEIILFSANRQVIARKIFEKKQAALKFYMMSDIAILEARVQGQYSNTGDVKWDSKARTQTMEGARNILIDGFERHEKKLGAGLMANSNKTEAGISTWTRPIIKWCTAGLKLLPGKGVSANRE
ncbi:hypothetical protein N431DRAFT_445287 [Stipitochalara longipes BDJ]|nr:hypothetical protein N431DRAFT_445287 [Stipitochalara longipes BDJ]